MSQLIRASISCPHCHTQYEAELFRSIWGENPQNKAMVFSDQINRTTCPRCGQTSFAIPSLLYSNKDLHRYAWRPAAARTGVRQTPPPLAAPAHRRAADARKEFKLSRRSLSKTGNVPKITHKKCYRPVFPYQFLELLPICNARGAKIIGVTGASPVIDMAGHLANHNLAARAIGCGSSD